MDIVASRSHEVIKVYVSGPDGLDLLLIGRLIAGWVEERGRGGSGLLSANRYAVNDKGAENEVV